MYQVGSLSPCLSVCVRRGISDDLWDGADIPGSIRPSNLVFIQYLYAIAVVEACQLLSPSTPSWAEKVHLKWPNDIYASFSPSTSSPLDAGRASAGAGKTANWTKGYEMRKIGGILVNTSFGGGKADVVIGALSLYGY